MKLSDYVMQRIAGEGVRHVFLVPGGAAMHLNDSLGKTPGLSYVATFHEHAAAVAAECYGKTTNNLGVAMVTAGPGSTNAITGVASAWVNSSPLLVLSGQVKRSDLIGGSGLRQHGLQEIDIESIVRPITKYVATVRDPSSTPLHLERAIRCAKSGRPGPVWLVLPLDVQGAEIESAPAVEYLTPGAQESSIDEEVLRAIEWLNEAERPILLAGAGIRIGAAVESFRRLIRALAIPVQTTWVGADLVSDEDPLFAGRPGAFAPRWANFAVQNSDFLLAIGARLDFATIGFSRERFARAARRVVVDVDRAELRKLGDDSGLKIHADARAFIDNMLVHQDRIVPRRRDDWWTRLRDWKARYPVLTADFHDVRDGVSTYVLVDALSELLSERDLIVEGSSGVQSEIFFLAFRVKSGQRILADGSLGAMGYGLPAAIGACVASGSRTILVDGDGSIQPNIQELETVRRLHLPLKIVIVNNGGYSSIRSSQQRYFQRLVAADNTSGMSFPSLEALSRAYGVPYARVSDEQHLKESLCSLLSSDGPGVCDVIVPAEEDRVPRIANIQKPGGGMISRPLEDLYPFLDRREFMENMIIPPISED